MNNIEPTQVIMDNQMSHIIETANADKKENEVIMVQQMDNDINKDKNNNKETSKDNDTDWDAIYQYFIDNDMSSYDQDYEYSPEYKEWPLEFIGTENEFSNMDSSELDLDI